MKVKAKYRRENEGKECCIRFGLTLASEKMFACSSKTAEKKKKSLGVEDLTKEGM